jgi:phosphoribosyl 1,2-cyclic phosphodiesterase
MPARIAMNDSTALSVTFWGVRGSICASGPRFVEFGGHTPCLEVRCGPRLYILDAGTGLSALGAALGERAPDEVDVLLTHLHLDHIEGLPFFKPALLTDRLVRVHAGNLGGASPEEPLKRLYAPPLFPIRLDDLPGRFAYFGFKAGETLDLAPGDRVRTVPLNHPNGATGYRFDHGRHAICYLSDCEHTEPWPDPALVDFVRGADLVIYDGMFSQSEYTRCKGWGHSTWRHGAILCKAAGAAALAVIHLHPQHDDDYLRALEAEMKQTMPSAFVAREGQTVAFPPAS